MYGLGPHWRHNAQVMQAENPDMSMQEIVQNMKSDAADIANFDPFADLL